MPLNSSASRSLAERLRSGEALHKRAESSHRTRADERSCPTGISSHGARTGSTGAEEELDSAVAGLTGADEEPSAWERVFESKRVIAGRSGDPSRTRETALSVNETGHLMANSSDSVSPSVAVKPEKVTAPVKWNLCGRTWTYGNTM